MRPLAFFALGLVSLAACRRPPPPPVYQPLRDPNPAEVEEDEEPPAPKPAPPPPPAKPTSAPPSAEAGFAFGLSRRDAMNLCSTRGVWRRVGENYSCTKPLEDAGLPGGPVLSFCNDAMCAIGIAYTPEGTDYGVWSEAFSKMREVLVARHGEPTEVEEQVPDECKTERIVECLEAGRASQQLLWRWDDHVVRLTLSKKRAGEGPAAIRFVSTKVAPSASE